VDLLKSDGLSNILNTFDSDGETHRGNIKGLGVKVGKIVSVLAERRKELAEENEELLIKMGDFCKELDYK
jgi:hypothetical protein